MSENNKWQIRDKGIDLRQYICYKLKALRTCRIVLYQHIFGEKLLMMYLYFYLSKCPKSTDTGQ